MEEHGCAALISIATPMYCKDSSKPYLSYVEAKITTQSPFENWVNQCCREVPLPSKSLCHYKNKVGCFNHKVVTMVADKLERQWYCNCIHKATWEAAAQFILQPQRTVNPQNICERVTTNALQSCSKDALNASRWLSHRCSLRVVGVLWL